MPIISTYLIIRADGKGRVVNHPKKLALDEVGFPLRIIIPDSWGKMHGEIIAELPDVKPPSAKLGAPETPTPLAEGLDKP